MELYADEDVQNNITNEQDNETNFEFGNLTAEEIFAQIKGLDIDGMPTSAISFSNGLEPNEDNLFILSDAIVDLYENMGCVTIEIAIKPHLYADADLIVKHLQEKTVPNQHFLIVPYAYRGEIVVVLSNVAYARLFDLQQNGKVLVVSFDNISTQIVCTDDDSNFEETAREARDESRKANEDLDNEINEILAEQKSIDDQMNPIMNQLNELRESARREGGYDYEE